MALLLIVYVAFNENKSRVKISVYQTNAISKPKATVTQVFADFGSMKVTDEKTAEFTIENTGNQPLQLFKVSSSCGCTIGTISINGQKSPAFSMHSKSSWTGTLDPNEKATVAVTYKPSIMPVKGEVTRAVYVSTNDPDNKELTFTVKANVD